MKTFDQWKFECLYIDKIMDKGGLVPEMNNDINVFLRYCEMQRNQAEKDGQFDSMTFIQHIIDDIKGV